MPTLPPVHPETTTSGIATDPNSQDRVVPQSVRPDGSVRKTIKIRPGFTPQEDVQRFRGTRQQDLDKRQLPPGHILGWVAPTSETKVASTSGAAATPKSAAKNAKRNAKKKEEKQKALEEKIRECWEDDDDTVKKLKTPRAESSGESSKADLKTKETDDREEVDLAEGMSKLVV